MGEWQGDPAYSHPSEADGYRRDWDGDPLAQVAADAPGHVAQEAFHTLVENALGNIGFS